MITKHKSRYVVRHKNGKLMGSFKTKTAALKQNKAVHAYYSAKKKVKKTRRKSKR